MSGKRSKCLQLEFTVLTNSLYCLQTYTVMTFQTKSFSVVLRTKPLFGSSFFIPKENAIWPFTYDENDIVFVKSSLLNKTHICNVPDHICYHPLEPKK